MTDAPYNLAIETSSRRGTVTLGRGDDVLGSAALPDAQKPPRRSVDLVPTIDALMREHGASPAALGEVYVSIGPGSFTGLRIAVATVKLLAKVLGVKVAAVPTLDVVAQNAPGDLEATLAVCLNLKRDTVWAGLYDHGTDGEPSWRTRAEPSLVTLAELIDTAPRSLAVLGDPLPELPGGAGDGVTVLEKELAAPRSEAVWQLGRERSGRGEWADVATLVPLYVRPPEAVTLWEKRHGTQPVSSG